MGLMRWLRGGDENSAASQMISAGLAEIDALFRPGRHKQTEYIEETKRRRIDVSNGDVDLEHGIVVIRRPPAGATDPAGTARQADSARPDDAPAARDA